MRVRNLRTTMLGVLCAGAVACPAFGDLYDYTWDHPCADDPAGTLIWEEGPDLYYCQGEWDNQDHWLSKPDGYPSDASDTALIEHSNTGYCSEGPYDGYPCSGDGDCPGGTCDNYEDHLKVDVANETIAYLLIRTKDSSASDDSLEVRFNNIWVCSGSGEPCESHSDCPFMQRCVTVKTLTVGAFVIHAENGPATFRIYDATIKTDPTD